MTLDKLDDILFDYVHPHVDKLEFKLSVKYAEPHPHYPEWINFVVVVIRADTNAVVQQLEGTKDNVRLICQHLMDLYSIPYSRVSFK